MSKSKAPPATPPVKSSTNEFVAGMQIKLVFLQILLDRAPQTCDFDLVYERLDISDELDRRSLCGCCIRELQIAKLIVEVGVTKSTRPIAKGGKRSLWCLVNVKRASDWVETYKRIHMLPNDPQGNLFGGGA